MLEVARILVVEDDTATRQLLVKELAQLGLEVTGCDSAERGLSLLEDGLSPQVVLSDLQMSGMDGVELLLQVRRRWPRIRRVFVTGFSNPAVLQRAVNEAQIHRFLARPWSREALVQVVERALKDWHDIEKLSALTEDIEAQVAHHVALLGRAKAEWLRTVDAIADPLTLISPDWVIQRTNLVLAQQTGIPIQRIVGRRCWETVVGAKGPCEGCPVPACLAAGSKRQGEILDPATGTHYRVLAYPVPGDDADARRVVCTYRDITEERELQAQLVQSEKMAAVGTLAGGVAHEINNPLGGILAWTQILLREVEADTDQHVFLKEIEDSALRCKKIVQSLLDYARESPSEERSTIDLNQVVERALFLVESTYTKKGVTIERDLCVDLWPVRGNATRVQQVVVNLLTNAFGAIERVGTIRVSTRNEATSAVVEVSDDGCGIAPDSREKVFIPFFTTKAQGEGTGLGLAVSYGIVESHQGTITFDSEVGQGTKFRMTLPGLRVSRPEMDTV